MRFIVNEDGVLHFRYLTKMPMLEVPAKVEPPTLEDLVEPDDDTPESELPQIAILNQRIKLKNRAAKEDHERATEKRESAIKENFHRTKLNEKSANDFAELVAAKMACQADDFEGVIFDYDWKDGKPVLNKKRKAERETKKDKAEKINSLSARDQLLMIWKGLDALANGNPLPDDVVEMSNSIRELHSK